MRSYFARVLFVHVLAVTVINQCDFNHAAYAQTSHNSDSSSTSNFSLPSTFTIRYLVTSTDLRNAKLKESLAQYKRMQDEELLHKGIISESKANQDYEDVLKASQATKPSETYTITISSDGNKLYYSRIYKEQGHVALVSDNMTTTFDYSKKNGKTGCLKRGQNFLSIEPMPLPGAGTKLVPFLTNTVISPSSLAGATHLIEGRTPSNMQGNGQHLTFNKSQVIVANTVQDPKVLDCQVFGPNGKDLYEHWNYLSHSRSLNRWLPDKFTTTTYNNYMEDGKIGWAPETLYTFKMIDAKPVPVDSKLFKPFGIFKNRTSVNDEGVYGEPISFTYLDDGTDLESQIAKERWHMKIKIAKLKGGGIQANAPSLLFVLACFMLGVGIWIHKNRKSTV